MGEEPDVFDMVVDSLEMGELLAWLSWINALENAETAEIAEAEL